MGAKRKWERWTPERVIRLADTAGVSGSPGYDSWAHATAKFWGSVKAFRAWRADGTQPLPVSRGPRKVRGKASGVPSGPEGAENPAWWWSEFDTLVAWVADPANAGHKFRERALARLVTACGDIITNRSVCERTGLDPVNFETPDWDIFHRPILRLAQQLNERRAVA